tara:strand:+ start:858 stop:1028 length:171 start_codon:yes stop_codon:yes gene_type:complete
MNKNNYTTRVLSLSQIVNDDEPLSNCCHMPFGYPGWPDSDICYNCGEHADINEEKE